MARMEEFLSVSSVKSVVETVWFQGVVKSAEQAAVLVLVY